MAPIPSGTRVWRWGHWVSRPSSATPANDVPGLRFLEFNMCGSACNKGDVIGVVDELGQSIVEYRPDIVLLNEACLGQVDRLWDQLTLMGYRMSACFGATTGTSRCPGAEGERWYGNAVFTRGSGIGAPEMLVLPNRSAVAEQRSVISMAADLRGVRALISATHLSPRSKDQVCNRLQISEVARIQNEKASAGNIVVFGGDFNATPDQLQEIYVPGGRFQEVDYVDNEATYSTRKIDFIFLNVQKFSGLSGQTATSRFSDHRSLKGQATLRA